MFYCKRHKNMGKHSKSIVRIPGSIKPKIIEFKSTKSNIKKVISESRGNPERLIANIGHLEVSEFFKIITNNPKYERVMKFFGKTKMSDFLKNNRELFLEILAKEIYK